ncbi:hypothetical protein HanRHA438_Chr08g0334961 [Helianthus annuus]|nr:hypothetical protein HanIR_Chr08g0349641 [Helianthus annuus]KAJ0896463.1 hypothetical protein HanRHA438_Chr08g0334961 [Helianthus annuus]
MAYVTGISSRKRVAVVEAPQEDGGATTSLLLKKRNNKKMKALQVNCFAWGIEGTGPNFYFNL